MAWHWQAWARWALWRGVASHDLKPNGGCHQPPHFAKTIGEKKGTEVPFFCLEKRAWDQRPGDRNQSLRLRARKAPNRPNPAIANTMPSGSGTAVTEMLSIVGPKLPPEETKVTAVVPVVAAT
jgi:hypothetical protein